MNIPVFRVVVLGLEMSTIRVYSVRNVIGTAHYLQYDSLLNSTEQQNKAGGQLFTVSAPSGAGKTSLVQALIAAVPNISVSVSHTTRLRRAGEHDGVNYHFVDQAQFSAMRVAGDFLEHATVFSNSYGTSRAEVEAILASGNDVILEIDWQGAEQIKQQLPETMSIFILPPSLQALEERLTGRGQDDAAVIAGRMQAAVNEISHYGAADYLVVNEVFETALAELEHIVQGQRLSLARQQQQHAHLLAELLA
ncbi:MAG: guanylate kinase [Pseudomonadales bacterium]